MVGFPAVPTMKAAVYRGRNDLRVEELPIPEPGRGEMLLKVDACGVCGTDVKKIEKGLLPPPRVFGHEIAARVDRVGPGVTSYREGQRVVVHHHVPCLSCYYCERRAYTHCALYKKNGTSAGFEPSGGGMSQYVRAMDWIVERGTIPIPDGVLAEEAVFVEPVNTCLKAVQKAKIGRGPHGAGGGSGADRTPAPADRALGRGRRHRLRHPRGPARHEPPSRRGGRPRRAGRRRGRGPGPDGRPRGRRRAPGGGGAVRLRPGGRGGHGRAARSWSSRPPRRGRRWRWTWASLNPLEKDILFSYSSSADIQDLAARLVFERQIDVRSLVTHRFPLEESARAVEVASRPAPGVLKVVVEMGRS